MGIDLSFIANNVPAIMILLGILLTVVGFFLSPAFGPFLLVFGLVILVIGVILQLLWLRTKGAF